MMQKSPKTIKSKFIEIYNEGLLNLNLYLTDENQLKNSKDLRYLVLNRLLDEFNDIDEDVKKDMTLLQIVPTFYERTYQLILNEYVDTEEIDNLTEDDILEIEDDSRLIEIAYNHSNPQIRSFVLGLLEKPYIWLDFLFNDPEESVRQDALFYLFGDEYFENLINHDYFGEIPIEIVFELDYDNIMDYFGIEGTLFKKYDRLVISELSFEDDNLIIRTDPRNSYEHAVSEIINQDALKYIANNHKEWSVRYIAVNRITEIDYLYEIASNGFDERTKPRHGILYYPGEIDQGNVLESLFYRLLSLMNFKKCDYQEFLLDLFYKSNETKIQYLCLLNIRDDSLLFNIGVDEANPIFADAALDAIKGQDYLILLSLAILRNPRFDGVHHIFNELGELEENHLNLSQFKEINYEKIRAKACRKLISLSDETLEKTIRDLPSINQEDINEKEYLKGIADKRIIDILLDIAKTDESSSVRSIAVLGIDDEVELKSIALNDEDRHVSSNAIRNIDDEDFIRDYVLEYKKDPYQLVNENLIRDQSLLAYIARNDSWWGTRKEAVKNLEDKETLEFVAKNDPEGTVRFEAIRKIENQDILIDLAYNDSYDLVKDSAISRIDDEEILEDLIYKIDDSSILRTILSKIDNEEIINDFAYNHPDANVRSYAASNIKDNRILVDLAKNDDDWTVRMNVLSDLIGEFIRLDNSKSRNNTDKALYHLNKRGYLESLIVNDDENEFVNKNNHLKSVDENDYYIDANSIILYEVNDEAYTLQDLLVDRAYNDSKDNVRELAVSYISDEDILFDIAINDKSIDVCISAVEAIRRNELLAKIFVKSKNHHVYRKAISRIKYEYVLLKLLHLKHFYGELWQKEDMVKCRLWELGFRAPFLMLED